MWRGDEPTHSLSARPPGSCRCGQTVPVQNDVVTTTGKTAKVFLTFSLKRLSNLNRNQALLDRVFDQLSAIVHVDFPHQIVFMNVDSLDAEIQTGRYFLYGQPFG